MSNYSKILYENNLIVNYMIRMAKMKPGDTVFFLMMNLLI